VLTAGQEQQSVHVNWKGFAIALLHATDDQTSLIVEDQNKSEN